MVAPVIFLSRFKAGFVATWKSSCGKPWDCFTRYANPNLSRNVSKFYAWQVGSWMNEQQSKSVAQSRPHLYYSQQQVKHARSEIRNSQVGSFLYRIYRRSLPSVKAAIYEIRVFVSGISPPLEHSARYSFCFVVQHKLGGLHVLKENLKMYINKESLLK